MGRFPLFALFREAKNVFTKDELGLEIAHIAIPSALALTADPIASLIDTAFIGHIGPVELAAVGISIAIFNQASKIAIFPLVSITTSFVAEEEAAQKSFDDIEEPGHGELRKDLALNNNGHEMEELVSLIDKLDSASSSSSITSDQSDMIMLEHVRRHIPSASSAMVIGSMLGLIQALFLILAAKRILNYMGVDSNSPMQKPAMQYLTLRSLGAPAVLLSLAMQGVFRGLKDTKTPLYATMIGDAANIILDPIFIFFLKWGISGAAVAHVISQIFLTGEGHCCNILCNPGSIVGCKAWLDDNGCIPSLLTGLDGYIFGGRWLGRGWTGNSCKCFCEGGLQQSHCHCFSCTSGLVLGLFLSFFITIVLKLSSKLFTKDPHVLDLMSLGIPFVAVTQPINALAFVFDGINYGASDFAYSAYSMVFVAIVSIWCLFVLSSSYGFVGIWIALSLYMTLRTFVGFWRVGTGTGPWRFLRD
ncbi:protein DETOXIFICATION 42-like isoform X2 [Humulus lupulus]|uniref:protein DETOXIFICATION 42-like isoform X2 n=1 Tax=Humulus lupulus TaxID=3486 RepID=UPI002B40A657|nr:protein DETOXIFICATION 42-like isoform X2 [Humulus lupulus]